MAGGVPLPLVQGLGSPDAFTDCFDRREQQSVEQLLRNHGRWRSEISSYLERPEIKIQMKAADQASRKQEFTREKVHLDFPALLRPMVDDTFGSNRCRLGRSSRIVTRLPPDAKSSSAAALWKGLKSVEVGMAGDPKRYFMIPTTSCGTEPPLR